MLDVRGLRRLAGADVVALGVTAAPPFPLRDQLST